MSKPNLTLVHDFTSQVEASTRRAEWGFENARQLSLFKEDQKDSLCIVTMSKTDRHRFKSLLMECRPLKVLDTRIYPDFFGFFGSTKSALRFFGEHGSEYVHLPITLSLSNSERNDWGWKGQFLDGLRLAKSESDDFVNNFLLLVASEETVAECNNLLRSDPSFEDAWCLKSI